MPVCTKHGHRKLRVDRDPNLTEFNQNSEFWIGPGFDPKELQFGSELGLQKSIELGLGWI
jgi:hypothetical protein